MEFAVKQIKLDELGTSKVLGFLEAEVMDIVWSSPNTSVRSVCDELAKHKQYSFNTVMTIMNRLVEKNLLSKTLQNGMFVYAATASKEDFKKSITKSVLASLIHDRSVFHVAAFAEAVADLEPEAIEMLQDLIKNKSYENK